MFRYLKTSARERLPLFLSIILVVSLLSFGYAGSRTVTDRINIVATSKLASNWRSHYDLLVLPKNATERERLLNGWIAPHSPIANYGGISIEDLEVIRKIAGVEIAAPLAIIGYSTVNGIDVEYIDAIPGNFYTVQHVKKVFDGLKTYEIQNKTELKRFLPIGTDPSSETIEMNTLADAVGTSEVISTEMKKPNELLIIAIDPEAEDKLFTFTDSLERNVSLKDVQIDDSSSFAGIPMIPVVKLATSDVKMEEIIAINAVEIPKGFESSGNLLEDEKKLLKTPEVNIAFNSFQSKWNRNHVALNVEKDATYKELKIAKFASSSIDIFQYSPIEFSTNELEDEVSIPIVSAIPVAIDGASELPLYREKLAVKKKAFGIDVLDYYHPNRIKPLLNNQWKAGEPVDVYTPHHSMIIEDGAGNPISPTPLLPLPLKNTYSTGPPDLITTIEAASYFYGAVPPISSIRVVVNDVVERTPENQRKVEKVAAEIEERTGHSVELMLGSTAAKVHIDLGNKEVGAPGVVEEGWQKEGANWSIQEQVEQSNILLFSYTLLISMIFCYTLITHSLLRRSKDFALLRAIGWGRQKVVLALLLEVLLLCTLSLLPLVAVNILFNLIPWREIAFIVSVCIFVIGLGYFSGSKKALRLSPRAGLKGEGADWKFLRFHSFNGLFTYSLHQLARRPIRFGLMSLVMGLTSFMGVLFTVTQKSLSDYLFLSFLGETIDLQLSGLQKTLFISSVILTFVTLFVLHYLNTTERQSEFAILRSIGWSNRRLQFYTGLEVLLVSTVGSGFGGLVAYGFLYYTSDIELRIWFVLNVLVIPVGLLLLFSIVLMHALKNGPLKFGQYTG